MLKNIEDLSLELKTLEENKNNSSLSQNKSKSNTTKINKSNSAKEIFPPIGSNSTNKNKISQISENSSKEIIYD